MALVDHGTRAGERNVSTSIPNDGTQGRSGDVSIRF